MTIIENLYINGKQVLFCHIPKTGGISILKTLGSDSRGHASLKNFQPTLINTYYKVAFVRNPYDRLVSCFFYLQNGINIRDRKDYEKYLKKYSGDFKLFIKEGLKESGIMQNQQHFKKQVFYLRDSYERINIDFLGKFEIIYQDFQRLCIMAHHKKIELKHENKGDHEYYSTYYDHETKNIVYDLYKEDFDILGYRK